MHPTDARFRFERLLARRADRRRLVIGGGAALTATSLFGRPTRVLGQATPAASPAATRGGSFPFFTLGVASGDPTPDGVVLWTRLAPSPLGGGGMDPIPYEVRWEVANDDAFADVVQSGRAVASPLLAHSVHLDVTGLEPAREYFYRFMLGDEVSATGRTKTAPAMGAEVDRLRFGFASCSMWEHGWFTAYRDMARQGFDLILHLGDYIYEYEPNGYDVRDEGPLREHTGADDAIGETDSLPSTGTALPSTAPTRICKRPTPRPRGSSPGTTTRRRTTTPGHLRERRPGLGVPRPPCRRLPGLLRAHAAAPGLDAPGTGHAALSAAALRQPGEFVVLDTRQYRDDQPCGDGVNVRCPAALDPDTTLLGPEQERWLLQTLDASPARWNVLAQQVMMAELEQGGGAGGRLLGRLLVGLPDGPQPDPRPPDEPRDRQPGGHHRRHPHRLGERPACDWADTSAGADRDGVHLHLDHRRRRRAGHLLRGVPARPPVHPLLQPEPRRLHGGRPDARRVADRFSPGRIAARSRFGCLGRRQLRDRGRPPGAQPA
jgi:alkaline phosphatase D